MKFGERKKPSCWCEGNPWAHFNGMGPCGCRCHEDDKPKPVKLRPDIPAGEVENG